RPADAACKSRSPSARHGADWKDRPQPPLASFKRTNVCAPRRRHGWRGGRVVEGARLESVYTGNRIAGSNPALSANQFAATPPVAELERNCANLAAEYARPGSR